MTWLDLGNGWRNLFLLSAFLQAVSLGTLFAARRWFSTGSRLACFLTGAAATPLLEYLWMLALAFLWPHAPKLVYIGVPPLAAGILLAVMLLRRIRRIPALFRRGLAFVRRLCHFDKPALIALCFALCMVILLAPVCVRFLSSMNCAEASDAGEYLALAQRYCTDRNVGELLEKNETEGHFRGNSHFPSLELYMSYGLFHTGGDSFGYPYDKPAFTAIGLLLFYVAAAYGALLLTFCREKKGCALLGVLLFNLVPNLYYSVASAPRDMWRILAVLLSVMAFAGLQPRSRSVKAYLGKLLFAFALCFTVMSTHVVCFVVLPFVVVAWVIWRWMESLMLRRGGAGRTLLSSIGVALAGAAGTITAYLGNLWCFRQWGEMSPWRLMTSFTDAPWYDLYMKIEYKLEETTTHLDFWSARNDILLSYATPVGIWGFRLALLGLLAGLIFVIWRRVALRRQSQTLLMNAGQDGPTAVVLSFREDDSFRTVSPLLFCSLCTLLTAASMLGFLDTPLYSFSGSFLKLPRYTLQWFLLACVMICVSLSALSDVWPKLCEQGKHWLRRRQWRIPAGLVGTIRRLPAWFCALLCVLGMVQGTRQTGYAASFYRNSRNVMENESILMDNGFREHYGLLMTLADALPADETILITQSGYQYPLKGKGYLLQSNPIVPILNMTEAEIPGELERLHVGMIVTNPSFWDDRYLIKSTLNDYLTTLPSEQIVETGFLRFYLLDPALVPVAQAALETTN